MLGADENATGEMGPEARTSQIYKKMDTNGDGVCLYSQIKKTALEYNVGSYMLISLIGPVMSSTR